MPPHCDSLDGPVAKAAIAALEAGDVELVLPYVKAAGESEVRKAFELTLRARVVPEAREVADLYFFDTVVRVHRAGEGAPYTGLKPAGLDVGPVIPLAETAVGSGSPDELVRTLADLVHDEVKQRLDRVMSLRPRPGASVQEVREWVEEMLGLQVWSHEVYLALRSKPHGEGHEHD
jgi:hypothetical protein